MNFNLLPWREAARTKQRNHIFIELIFSLFIVLSIIQIIKIYYAHAIDQKKSALRKSQQQIEILQTDYLSYLAVINNNKNNDMQVQIISAAVARYEMILNFLTKIRIGIPQEIQLTKLHINDHFLQLEGEAASHAGIATLLKYLENLTNSAQPINTETTYDENNIDTHFLITYNLPFNAH